MEKGLQFYTESSTITKTEQNQKSPLGNQTFLSSVGMKSAYIFSELNDH